MKHGAKDNTIRVFSRPREGGNPFRNRAVKAVLTVLSVAAFWLGLWMILSQRVNSELLLPSPVSVFKRLFRLSGTSELWKATGATLGRIILGYLGGVLAGTLLAALTAWSSWISAVAAPIGRIAKATPVASFIILALVWLPAANIPSFIVFLLVTPIVWDALKTALLSADRALLEMAKAYRFGFLRTVLHVYLPSALPAYISSVITSLGLAWKSGIAAEVLCLPKISIGRLLHESKIYLEMTDLFAWTTLVVILSVIMEAAIRLAVKRLGSGKAAVGSAALEDTADNEKLPDVADDELPLGAAGNASAATEDDSAAISVAQNFATAPAATTQDQSQTDAAAIDIRSLSKSYGSNHIFTGFSVAIPGGITCLTGVSGSGKTTLARILAGLEDGDSGSISGVDSNVVFLFQEPRLLPWKTAAMNVALAFSADAASSLSPAQSFPAQSASEELSPAQSPSATWHKDYIKKQAEKFLLMLGLTKEDINKKPSELSGGMQQRVALARAAMSGWALRKAGKRVSLTVLDEPLKGLDPATRAAAVRFIKTELCVGGEPVIIITHSRDDIDDFGGNILNIDGKNT